jgi:hypothetical protein
MARGGKTTPSPRTPPGGPGQYSRRTDGQQVATPGLTGSEMQYGDVQKLEGTQRSMPLPSGGARPIPRPQPGERRPTGSGPSGREGGVPPHLLTMEPDTLEPTTTGLDMGQGPGSEVLDAALPAPDVREQVLEYVFLRYRNNDAFQMLQKLRAERGVASDQAVTQEGLTMAAPTADTATPPIPEPMEG